MNSRKCYWIKTYEDVHFIEDECLFLLHDRMRAVPGLALRMGCLGSDLR